MSPELETLDQLLCGDMPLAVIRELFDDGERFARAVAAMLHAGELRLHLNGDEAPYWRWPEVLAAARDRIYPADARLDIAEAGVRRIVG
ncbi:hypothetical protein [Planctomyces sp. SH-PL62]|uniref:hypothetical protein n=1 Tax=Planctomyces sp. SH-PL62 TaxID=1636152 RepID=UPI00078EF469|nr:hypothetical protein [Planctomyces sp. SH-PL62]AMV37881.1 hypothetical protein VT85_10615 [Planctomyces sp. SH-PL62]